MKETNLTDVKYLDSARFLSKSFYEKLIKLIRRQSVCEKISEFNIITDLDVESISTNTISAVIVDTTCVKMASFKSLKQADWIFLISYPIHQSALSVKWKQLIGHKSVFNIPIGVFISETDADGNKIQVKHNLYLYVFKKNPNITFKKTRKNSAS